MVVLVHKVCELKLGTFLRTVANLWCSGFRFAFWNKQMWHILDYSDDFRTGVLFRLTDLTVVVNRFVILNLKRRDPCKTGCSFVWPLQVLPCFWAALLLSFLFFSQVGLIMLGPIVILKCMELIVSILPIWELIYRWCSERHWLMQLMSLIMVFWLQNRSRLSSMGGVGKHF